MSHNVFKTVLGIINKPDPPWRKAEEILMACHAFGGDAPNLLAHFNDAQFRAEDAENEAAALRLDLRLACEGIIRLRRSGIELSEMFLQRFTRSWWLRTNSEGWIEALRRAIVEQEIALKEETREFRRRFGSDPK